MLIALRAVSGAALLLALALAAGCPPDAAPVAGVGDAGAADAGPLDGGGAFDGGRTDGGPAPDGGADAGPQDGGANDAGDDACSAQECPDGACVPLPDDAEASRYCVAPVEAPREACVDGGSASGFGDCCVDDDCFVDGGPGALCVALSYRYCGGAPPPEANVCLADECEDDGDCGAGRACLPRGAFGSVVALCVDAACRSDGDCTDGAGGRCVPLSTGRCGTVGGFYCTYDDDPCRSDGDCPSTSFPERCLPADGGTACVESVPVP